MTWRVSLYWQLDAAYYALGAAIGARTWGPPSYIDGGFLADAVGHWDHERKCVK